MQVISVDEYIKWFGTFTIPFYIKVAIIVGIVTYFAKQWLDSTLRVCNIVKYRIELIKAFKKINPPDITTISSHLVLSTDRI